MKYIYFLLSILFLMSCNYSPSQNQKTSQDAVLASEESYVLESDTVTSDPVIDTLWASIDDNCYLFDSFTDSPEFRWGIVNDGVMWGRSQGSSEIVDDKLVFSWEIVTRWGGFSSLRWALESWILSEYNSVKLRAKSDGREYRITFRDSRWGRISHRAVLDFKTPWEFEEITIPFTDLQPAYFGRSVKADPFEKESAREIGVILSDWVDGDFELVIDEVRFCR